LILERQTFADPLQPLSYRSGNNSSMIMGLPSGSPFSAFPLTGQESERKKNIVDIEDNN
jgi:hypothetical protein